VRAISIGDIAQFVDSSDECANEAQVDKGNEVGIVLGEAVAEDCAECPNEREYGDNEEDEDEGWCEHVVLDEAVDKPREHSNGRYQSDDFGESPERKEEAGKHCCCKCEL